MIKIHYCFGHQANHDWDPGYLSSIFDMDFYDFNELWGNSVNDTELITAAKHVET